MYDYEYDGEGNLVKRTEISSGDYRVFEWDHRNRLASISDFDDLDDLQLKVTYLYDAFDRLIGKRVDENGNGTIDRTEAFVYDGNQIVLQFGDDDAAALAASDLTHRYLWGPAVDQLLADEEVTSLTSAGTVSWALSDHLNTVRDVVQYSGGTTSVVNHNAYDAFGNKLSQSSPSHDVVFGYTGRIYDADTGLQWHGSQDGGGRWYDTATGRWISEDPIGFAGDASNLYRYVGNAPTIYIDPSGMAQKTPIPRVDNTGRIHGNIPDYVPPEWCEDDIWDALNEVENSLNQRKIDQRDGTDPEQVPGHSERVRRETNWKKQLDQKLQNLPSQCVEANRTCADLTIQLTGGAVAAGAAASGCATSSSGFWSGVGNFLEGAANVLDRAITLPFRIIFPVAPYIPGAYNPDGSIRGPNDPMTA